MAGATGTRLNANDVSVFTIGGVSFIGHFKSFDIKEEIATIENRAAQDTDAYPRAGVRSWSITGELVVDTTGVTYPAGLQTKVHDKTAVTVVINTGGGGIATGSGLMTSFTHSVSEGQTQNVEITGQGPLAWT